MYKIIAGRNHQLKEELLNRAFMFRHLFTIKPDETMAEVNLKSVKEYHRAAITKDGKMPSEILAEKCEEENEWNSSHIGMELAKTQHWCWCSYSKVACYCCYQPDSAVILEQSLSHCVHLARVCQADCSWPSTRQ